MTTNPPAKTDGVSLADDCVWTDPDRYMSDPNPRKTGLPGVRGYEVDRYPTGGIKRIRVEIEIGDGSTSHRGDVVFRKRDEGSDDVLRPTYVEFKHYDDPPIGTVLTALEAGIEGIRRLGIAPPVISTDGLLAEIRTKEPAEDWEVEG